MNETSLNTTQPQSTTNMTQESTNYALEEAMSLLIAWNLPQLCEKFREQEVCTNAFHCLTDADIIQLVPKIGPRAIFCVRLKEWLLLRSTVAKDKPEMQSISQQHASEHHFTDLLGAVKLEMKEAEPNWLNNVNEIPAESMPLSKIGPAVITPAVTVPATVTAETEINDLEPTEEIQIDDAMKNVADINQKLQVNNINGQVFVNIREILTNNFYGLKALEYYENHQTLDAVQRKKIVEIIISTVMEQHVVMSSQCFTDLAQQVVDIFPNECTESYYTPRVGLTCPKGALYNKYLNMGKAMRRSGLLEYRVGRRGVRHNPIYQK